MADSISRSLRDGYIEGEHARSLSIKDSLQCPLGSHAFDHFLSNLVSNIAAAKSQARGLVLVAFDRRPSFYLDLLKSKGLDSSSVRILDCYSDPLGWKGRILKLGTAERDSVTVCNNVKDVSKLLNLIIDVGKGIDSEGKARFAVAIDSVSEILRRASLPQVANLISTLRSHDKVSCIFWVVHSDLHEPRASAALEYISTMVASLEPIISSVDSKEDPENLFWLEQNLYKGKFHVRMKRRNGRVKSLCEEVHLDEVGIKFVAVTSESVIVNQNLVPKVQFNLDLSEKEKVDRARVVLPFEHQGNGENIQIYDGRRSLLEETKDTSLIHALSVKTNGDTGSGRGEILYVRDSDDEDPDSDEDPDDDLDI